MKLPGATDKIIPELMEMIEKTKEEKETIIQVEAKGTLSKRMKVYATYFSETEEEGEVYFLFAPQNFSKRELFGSKKWLHNILKKEYEAETIRLEDIEDGKVEKTMKNYVEMDNPREATHIVVKTTDDGRYKDEVKYARTDKERDEKYIGGYNDEDSKFEYIDLGSFNEVLESDETYDFDLKKTGGRWSSVAFLTFTDKEEREEVKAKIQGIETDKQE